MGLDGIGIECSRMGRSCGGLGGIGWDSIDSVVFVLGGTRLIGDGSMVNA